MFQKTATKLAGLYLTIIMIISLFFSANIYQLSVQELDRSIRRPDINRIIDRLPHYGPFDAARKRIRAAQDQQYVEYKQNILQRLALVNLLILLLGGFLSYYLARRTLQPIEQAHEAQSRFTADASHELRTPIAAMRSEIEVALMDPKLTLKQTKDLLRSNLEELAKLTALSESLLRLAQLDSSELVMKPISAENLVSDAIGRVTAQAEHKNILISHTINPQLKISGDKLSLTEALVILLDNAVKYSPDKSEITVTAQTEQRSVILQVKDQGIGIKKSDLTHIFERFYRADAARSKQMSEGYGIGLAIAKNIIELNKGSISVQSTPGAGSIFTVVLQKA